ncbi:MULTISPECIES: hypothetical protein [unclassified Paenibacillus]|uniref:Gas vesicle protein n=1 Tax=Paenibacillus provencensis TaxID=441151 RepID=A0ABW3PLU5_9BACL|nr:MULTISPECIES: hypothetical protein [unclassified Paenibacillus]MCM3126531.1 hypothetical protein [Paenibacillus sp. MER 78]SFS59522.1 hypothetical protein SAMN04488601_1012301 [Paenibacillus sp. 453mf]
MRTSSFLLGITLGAVASSLLARNVHMPTSKDARRMLNNTKEKMMDMSFPGMGSMLSKAGIDSHVIDAKNSHSTVVKKQVSPKEREENMNLIKSFIRSNPDVKNEVEQVLKESHTVIPGM